MIENFQKSEFNYLQLRGTTFFVFRVEMEKKSEPAISSTKLLHNHNTSTYTTHNTHTHNTTHKMATPVSLFDAVSQGQPDAVVACLLAGADKNEKNDKVCLCVRLLRICLLNDLFFCGDDLSAAATSWKVLTPIQLFSQGQSAADLAPSNDIASIIKAWPDQVRETVTWRQWGNVPPHT